MCHVETFLVRTAQVRVSKWLKELEMMFYGSSLAYDKVRIQLRLCRGCLLSHETVLHGRLAVFELTWSCLRVPGVALL